MNRTYQFKVKSAYTKKLLRLSSEVNFVWNYLNDLNYYHTKNYGTFLSSYEMWEYLKGCTSGENGLKITTRVVQQISEKFYTSRRQAKKIKLSYRSNKSRKKLGWVPFRGERVFYEEGRFGIGKGIWVKVFESYNLKELVAGKVLHGSFNENAKGEWFLNLTVQDCNLTKPCGSKETGMDLGVKTLLTCSDGLKIESPRFYSQMKSRISLADKANKTKLKRALHRKVANRRKDFLHKLSNLLIDEYRFIVVGNVAYNFLRKTPTGKHAKDAGWYMFKRMLEYKALKRQAVFKVVDERRTSLTCSACGNHTGPTGLVKLKIREWTCSSCGSIHDRDVNAAKNILALGRQSLAEGASR